MKTDDDAVTQAFYEELFEWRFEPFHPGSVRTPLAPTTEVLAAVQTRRELLPGVRTNGPEVTIEVDDLDVVLARVEPLGGRVVMDRATIPSVGDLAFLSDPSGNLVGVIAYVRA